jgi:hypothetical protein
MKQEGPLGAKAAKPGTTSSPRGSTSDAAPKPTTPPSKPPVINGYTTQRGEDGKIHIVPAGKSETLKKPNKEPAAHSALRDAALAADKATGMFTYPKQQ